MNQWILNGVLNQVGIFFFKDARKHKADKYKLETKKKSSSKGG